MSADQFVTQGRSQCLVWQVRLRAHVVDLLKIRSVTKARSDSIFLEPQDSSNQYLSFPPRHRAFVDELRSSSKQTAQNHHYRRQELVWISRNFEMDFCKDDEWYEPGQEVALLGLRHDEPITKCKQVKEALPTRPSLSQMCEIASRKEAKRPPFVKLPPEIRNKIYGFVLARPTTTVIELDKDWKQPALSLTCHQIQSEMLSFWLGSYKCSFWPNRYGMEYSLSPLMKKWMTRAGKDAAKIRHLEINVRMPDYSRFSWQIKISNHGKSFVMSEVLLSEGSDRDNLLDPPMAAAPEASTQTSQSTGLARPKSSHWVVEPRDYETEVLLGAEIFDYLKTGSSVQSTRCLGLPEIEDILEIFNECGLDVPENLDARNPSWTEEFGGSYRIPKANAPQQESTRWAPVPWSVACGSLLDSANPSSSLKILQRRSLHSSGAASLAPLAASTVPESQQAAQASVDSDVMEYHSAGHSSVKPATMPTISETDFCQDMQNLSLTEWTTPMH